MRRSGWSHGCATRYLALTCASTPKRGRNPLLFPSAHSLCFGVVSESHNINNEVDHNQHFTRCRTLESTTALEIGVVTWLYKDKPAIRWEPFRAWPKPPTPEELAQAWREALNNSRFFRVCNRCGVRQNRGDMHDESVCNTCAERDFGLPESHRS